MKILVIGGTGHVGRLVVNDLRARGSLAMTLGYSSMDRVVSRRQHAATTKSLCGGPTGLPVAKMKNAAADENLPGRVQGDPLGR